MALSQKTLAKLFDVSFDIFCSGLEVSSLKKPHLCFADEYKKMLTPGELEYNLLRLTFGTMMYEPRSGILVVFERCENHPKFHSINALRAFLHELGHHFALTTNRQWRKKTKKEHQIVFRVFNEGFAEYCAIGILKSIKKKVKLVDESVQKIQTFASNAMKELLGSYSELAEQGKGRMIQNFINAPEDLYSYQYCIGYKFVKILNPRWRPKDIKKIIIYPPKTVEELLKPQIYSSRLGI